MEKKGSENYARTLLLLIEGGTFIAREILKREILKHEGNLGDFLKTYEEKLQRRFLEKRNNRLFPVVGEARPDDWDIALLIGVLLEIFRSTLTSREKRELLVLKNVRDELHAYITSPCLDENVFKDLQQQLVEALKNLATGLEPVVANNSQRMIDRYAYGPIHLLSSLDHLEDMCVMDEDFLTTVKTLREETKTVIDDIIELVHKAEDDGRTMKTSKVIEYTIKPQCEEQKLLESVDETLSEESDVINGTEGPTEYAKIRNGLEEFLCEIRCNGKIVAKYEKGTGLILNIECETYPALLGVLSFMESLQCIEMLEVIATDLKEKFGSLQRLFLVCSFSPERMKKLFEELKQDNIEYSRSISLSMRVNSLAGLAHVWDMFHSGGAQNHLNAIAEALSEYVGSKVTLKASLNVEKFKEALEEAVGESFEDMMKKKGTDKKESDKENSETNAGEREESGGQLEPLSASRRNGVEIIGVRAGTRKTTLFDETISEGEVDEITNTGFDAREGHERNAISDTTIEEPTGATSKEELTGATSKEEPTGATSKEELTGATSKEESTEDDSSDVNISQAGQEAKTNTTDPNNVGNTKPENLPPNQSHADDTTDQVNAAGSSGMRPVNLPSGDIPDNVRGTVNEFYRDIINTSIRGHHSSGASSGGSTTQTNISETSRRTTTRATEIQEPETEEALGQSYTKNIDLSRLLSLALTVIGINAEVLDQKRERIQISECLLNQIFKLSGSQFVIHHFGSEAEGTSVIGFNSSVDTLMVLQAFSVSQMANSFTQSVEDEHIILAEETRPGFMRLSLSDESFQAILNFSSSSRLIETSELCLLDREATSIDTGFQTAKSGISVDTVLALRMVSWPIEIQNALQRRAASWAFDTSSGDLTIKPLVLVPVTSKNSWNKEMEWRICTTYAEEILLASLNIYQRKVYILFRVIVKQLVNPKISKPLTSFMIKNIFLHVVSNTWFDIWNECSLVLSLNGCLTLTRQVLRDNFIPNFFIPNENLFDERLSTLDLKCADEILVQVISQPYSSISSIEDEHSGCFLDITIRRPQHTQKMTMRDKLKMYLQSLNHGICAQVLAYKDFLLEWIVERSTDLTTGIESHYTILKFLKTYTSERDNTSCLVAKAASLYISTSLASHLVCQALNKADTLERDWLLCASVLHFHRGMESDALSSRVKFITALIAMGHSNSAIEMIEDLDMSDEVDARAVCACRRSQKVDVSMVPDKKTSLETLMKSVSSCVVFLPTENQITPLAMRYETYRSEMMNRCESQTMLRQRWAVADAKVYFGFLNTSLTNTMLDLEMYLGATDVYHKETLLNFIGLFSELNGNFKKAVDCYRKSLEIESMHNVAKWLIALTMFRQWCRLKQASSMICY